MQLSSKKNTIQAKHIKNKSQYQVYEDELNNYKNRSRSNLQQWNMISSRLISPNQTKDNQKKNNKQDSRNPNYEKDSKNSKESNNNLAVDSQKYKDGGSKTARKVSSDVRQSRVSEVSKNTDNSTNPYMDKIIKQFDYQNYESRSNQNLQKQLKSMRQMLIQMNSLVTSKLNKYQLATFVPKSMYVENEPQKQEQILKSKIQLNSRIIESLQKQIKQIQQRDKQLQEKDYLIQLQQSSNAIFGQIRQKRRLRHQEGVNVDKLDNKLIQMRDAELDDQYKMVKVIKHNILYYFKKSNQNKTIIQELDKNYQDLISKDQKLTQKYNKYVKIAQEKNMLVKANKNYIQNKKMHDKLSQQLQQAKKKVQVCKRSKQVESQKIQKQIQLNKKQLKILDARTQELYGIVVDLSKGTDDIIEKNQISNKILNKMSYKFAQSLLKQNNSKVGQTVLQAFMQPQQKQAVKIQLEKQKLKLPIKKLNNSTQVIASNSSRYQTVDIENIQNKQQKDTKPNDKNMNTINHQGTDLQLNKSKQYRIKPTLSVKKRQINKSAMSYSTQVKMDKINQINPNADIIFRPKKLQKLLSNSKNKT